MDCCLRYCRYTRICIFIVFVCFLQFHCQKLHYVVTHIVCLVIENENGYKQRDYYQIPLQHNLQHVSRNNEK